MSVIRSTLSVTLLACAIGSVAAVEAEATKLGTEDAAPLSLGSYELDLGYGFTHATSAFNGEGDKEDRNGTRTDHKIGAAIKAGLAKSLDLTVSGGWLRTTDTSVDTDAGEPDSGSGFADMTVALKWLFFEHSDERSRIGVVLIPNVGVPMGEQAGDSQIPTASDVWTPGLKIATSGWYDQLAFNADLGYNRHLASEEKRGGTVGTWTADLALGWQMTSMIQPEIELNYSKDVVEADYDETWSLAAIAGVQITTDPAVYSLGVQHVLIGKNTEATTSLIAAIAIGF